MNEIQEGIVSTVLDCLEQLFMEIGRWEESNLERMRSVLLRVVGSKRNIVRHDVNVEHMQKMQQTMAFHLRFIKVKDIREIRD